MVGIQTFSKSAEVAVVHVFIISVHCYHLTPPHGSPKIVATSLAPLNVAPVWFPDLSKLLYVSLPFSRFSHNPSEPISHCLEQGPHNSLLPVPCCLQSPQVSGWKNSLVYSFFVSSFIHPFPLFLTQTRTWWSCLCLELEPQDSSLRVTSPGCIWRLESANRHRMSGVAERGCNSQAMLSEVTSLARVALML